MATPSSLRWTIALAALVMLLAMPLSAGAREPVCAEGTPVPLPGGGVACTHGDDPRPAGLEPFDERLIPLAASPKVTCVGDGSDGNRVQALYVVASDQPNRSSSVVPQIRQWITDVDSIFSNSSLGYDPDLVVRWVHDSSCTPVVKTVVIPPSADDSFAATIDALDAAGYGSPGQHYLTWVDADVYCGIAVNYSDDSPGQDNAHNGAYPLWARIDRDCWGSQGMVEAHELSHMLGAVQGSAPNATRFGHCTDENDVMCYVDGPGVSTSVVCKEERWHHLLDCNRDDYFNPAPDAGSYLADHWNIARSTFLHDRSGEPPAPGTEAGSDPDPDTNPDTTPASGFLDVGTEHPFSSEIAWLAASGITKGCNPPANDAFCPDDAVTRSQMAAFLVRGLGLGEADGDHFDDDDSSVLESEINRLAGAGITSGCRPGQFCPGDSVTRGQMAAFLARALDLPAAGADYFSDDAGSVFESDINRLAAAGITTGCGNGRYCVSESLTRAQMAAFLKRSLTAG
jgi:hypothetical protein